MGPPVGEEPTGLPRPGLGRHFSKSRSRPLLLNGPSENDHLVKEFDELAEFYEILVRPFSTPIFDEALAVIRPYLPPDARVMDAACGPGRELRRVAALVPHGEVIGVDLAAGMIKVRALVGPRARARQLRLLPGGRLQTPAEVPRQVRPGLQLPRPPPLPGPLRCSGRRPALPATRRPLLRDRPGASVVQRDKRAPRVARGSRMDRLEYARGVPCALPGRRVRANLLGSAAPRLWGRDRAEGLPVREVWLDELAPG